MKTLSILLLTFLCVGLMAQAFDNDKAMETLPEALELPNDAEQIVKVPSNESLGVKPIETKPFNFGDTVVTVERLKKAQQEAEIAKQIANKRLNAYSTIEKKYQLAFLAYRKKAMQANELLQQAALQSKQLTRLKSDLDAKITTYENAEKASNEALQLLEASKNQLNAYKTAQSQATAAQEQALNSFKEAKRLLSEYKQQRDEISKSTEALKRAFDGAAETNLEADANYQKALAAQSEAQKSVNSASTDEEKSEAQAALNKATQAVAVAFETKNEAETAFKTADNAYKGCLKQFTHVSTTYLANEANLATLKTDLDNAVEALKIASAAVKTAESQIERLDTEYEALKKALTEAKEQYDAIKTSYDTQLKATEAAHNIARRLHVIARAASAEQQKLATQRQEALDEYNTRSDIANSLEATLSAIRQSLNYMYINIQDGLLHLTLEQKNLIVFHVEGSNVMVNYHSEHSFEEQMSTSTQMTVPVREQQRGYVLAIGKNRQANVQTLTPGTLYIVLKGKGTIHVTLPYEGSKIFHIAADGINSVYPQKQE